MIRRRTITSYEWHVATGNETVVLLNCVKSFFRRLELIGGTEQLTTTGKNLFDKGKTVNGYLDAKGELVSSEKHKTSDFIEVKHNTEYYITLTKSIRNKFYDSSKNPINTTNDNDIGLSLNVGKTFTLSDNVKFIRFSLINDYLDTIMLNEGKNETPYEPYTGLKPSPSPEYQQEIKSAGRKSRNLFDINYFKEKSNL